MKQFHFDREKDIEILSEETIHQGFLVLKRYRYRHRLFSGEWSPIVTREVCERGEVAAALPYDPLLDKVVLIQQCRPGALHSPMAWILEAVAGVMDKKDRSPAELIQRELQEESGLVAKKLHKICEYWVSPGGSNEYLTLYCAEVDASTAGGIHGLPEEHEDIYVHVVSRTEAYEMVNDGRINNALTIIAVQWLMLNQKVFI